MLPSLGTLARISKALGVPEAVLIPGRVSPEEELYRALLARGVELRTREEAIAIAEIAAREITRARKRA